MNIEMLLEYLGFLKSECLRFASDDHADDSEVKLLQLEIDKFKSSLKSSSLDHSIKKLVLKIDFQLTQKPKSRFVDILILIFSFDWYHYRRRKENIANKLRSIALEIENTIFEPKAYH